MLQNARNLSENFRRPFLCSFFGDGLKKIFEKLFFGDRLKNLNIFLETLAPVSLASSIPSSVARGAIAPHWPEEYAKYPVFSIFEADFCPENRIASPQ